MKDLLLLIESSGPLAHVGLAAWKDEQWVAVAEVPESNSAEAAAQPEMQHTAVLLPLIKQVLGKAPPLATAAYNDLTSDGHVDLRRTVFARLAAVAVSSGPGSYTALRAGLSSAKGLCLALNIPLLKCDTLLGLALSARELGSSSSTTQRSQVGDSDGARTAALLFARRDEVYFAVYESDGRVAIAPAVAQLTSMWAQGLVKGGVKLVCGPDEAVLKSFCASIPNADRLELTSRTVDLSAINLLSECRIRIGKNQFDDLSNVTPDYLRAPFITQPRTRV